MIAGQKPKVLIVDDEPELLEIIVERFDMEGFEVFSAGGGLEAFDFLKTHKDINLVVSDVRMPEGDGVELLDKVKAMDSTILVVLMTGFSGLSEGEVYGRGADGLFAKPEDLRDMAKNSKKLLKPWEEKWLPGLEVLRKNEISMEFADFAKARTDKLFDLGRGGISVVLQTKVPPAGTTVGLNLKFKSGAISEISGVGLVRWSSVEAQFCGVELLSLNQSCRDRVIDWIKVENPKGFIPFIGAKV